MSSIVTFYSYKGGVGRSMALANIAIELARRNKKVLMVDWDLEAPGLERYFSSFKFDNTADGLLHLLIEYQKGSKPDYKDYLWKIDVGFSSSMSLLSSGREKDTFKYSSILETFDWEHFFAKSKGGQHIENLRQQWLNDFDIILIDSRTGLSDSSGICTIMLPDILVPMFTANYQSLFGIRDAVKFIQNSRQKLNIDRMALTILPIPSRFGTRVEFKESMEWLDRISDILKDCFSDWLPKWIEPRYILEQVKIPQVDYFSFGEKLAVVEQGTADPDGMGFIYSKIATLLSSEFSEIESFVGQEYYESKKKEYEKNRLSVTSEQTKKEYKYDVFISCPRASYSWVRELFIPALTEYLEDELRDHPQIFIDLNEVNSGVSWSEEILTAIQKSRTCIIIFSSATTASEFSVLEMNFIVNSFSSRQKATDQALIFPVAISERAKIPEEIHTYHVTDLRDFDLDTTLKSTKVRGLFGQRLQILAKAIAKSIKQSNQILETTVVDSTRLEKNNLNALRQLAKQYDDVRKTMPSGYPRTQYMENLVSDMKSKINSSDEMLPTFTKSKSAGERLIAIATLQKFPSIQYLDWLSEHVGNVEKPFIGYQASVALFIATRYFGIEYKELLTKLLRKSLQNINRFDHKDPNQIDTIKAALRELETK